MFKLGFFAVLSVSIPVGVGACVVDGEDGQDGAAGQAGQDGAPGAKGDPGAPGPQLPLSGVYTLANGSGANQVAAYVRASNGNLSRGGRFATGGAGLGAGIGSQGALVFDAASQRFFAVNPGDDTVSMLALGAGGELSLLAKVPSGGKRPVSVTVSGNTAYVANQGDLTATTVNANISGFRIDGANLAPLAGSTQPLSGAGDVRPTDIGFSPDGKFLVVAERFASKLDTFAVVNGVAQAGNFQDSAGMHPFAFDWSPEGDLVVAELGAGTATSSSVSSYALAPGGALTPITAALVTGQGAACWLVVAGGHAYAANAASGTITGVNIAETGELSLHEASGVTASPGGGAIDLAVTPDRGYLYSLAGNPRVLHVYEIGTDGGLAERAPLTDIPTTAVGLATR